MKISKVAKLIHVVRDRKVLLDADLAVLYGVSTKRLNQAVRRNLRRFPDDFMFQMTREEALVLRSQIATLKMRGSGRGRKYWPLAFTEQGVAMLSGVLNSERAIQVNIAIMRTFVRLRSVLTTAPDVSTRIRNTEIAIAEHDRELTEHAAHINQAFAEIRRIAKP